MRIVFHGRDTGYLAAFAAVLFLSHNRSPDLPLISEKAFQLLPGLDKPPGVIIPVERDNSGNLLCLLGRGKEQQVVIQALVGYSSIFSAKELMVFFDLSRYENNFLQLGGILYRLKRPKIARKILQYGIQLEYKKIRSGLEDFTRRIERGRDKD